MVCPGIPFSFSVYPGRTGPSVRPGGEEPAGQRESRPDVAVGSTADGAVPGRPRTGSCTRSGGSRPRAPAHRHRRRRAGAGLPGGTLLLGRRAGRHRGPRGQGNPTAAGQRPVPAGPRPADRVPQGPPRRRALLSSFRGEDPLPAEIERFGTPTVLVDRPTGYVPDRSVDVDDAEGARLTVRHLVEQGRRRIATITGPRTSRPGRTAVPASTTYSGRAGCTPWQRRTATPRVLPDCGGVRPAAAGHLCGRLPSRPSVPRTSRARGSVGSDPQGSRARRADHADRPGLGHHRHRLRQSGPPPRRRARPRGPDRRPALRPPVPQPSPGHRLRRRDGRGAHRGVHRTGDVALAHRTGRGSLLRRRRHAQAGGWPAHRAAGTAGPTGSSWRCRCSWPRRPQHGRGGVSEPPSAPERFVILGGVFDGLRLSCWGACRGWPSSSYGRVVCWLAWPWLTSP